MPNQADAPGDGLRRFAVAALYVSLAMIFLWVGALKYTAYEAEAIVPFVANNPLLSWLHGVFGIQGAAIVLSIFEIAAGVLILARWFSPTLSAIGGAIATFSLLLTLSCMLTTPRVFVPEAGGFPVLSAEIGQFLAKDMGLIAIALFILADSLAARARRRHA